MADPRINRTREHVFSVVRQMVEARDGMPVTMANLALTARVSRRTLTTHWDSMETLLTEALAASRVFELAELSSPVEERLRMFLNSVRTSISNPIDFTVMLTVAASEKSKPDPSEDAHIFVMTRMMIETFRVNVAPLTDEQYAILVGPILFRELFTVLQATDEMLDEIVAIGLGMIDALPS